MSAESSSLGTTLDVESLLLERAIERFLLAEADVLDERRFDDWLELLADDIRYWMPMRRNIKFGDWERENTRSGRDVCWFDESKSTLTQRVRQLQTGTHWAEEPVSRVSHVVSGVRVNDVTTDSEGRPALIQVISRFIVYRNRQETETDLFVGRRTDLLRTSGPSWKIAQRCILLDQSVLLAKNLTMFF